MSKEHRELTRYELGRLRLQAFELFNGWGERDEKDEFRKWSFAERKEAAVRLADWAASPPTDQEANESGVGIK